MKNTFTIKFSRGEKYHYTNTTSTTMTLGRSYKSDIIVPLEFLPEKYTFLRKKGKAVSLFLVRGMKGSYTNENSTIPIEDLISSGILKRKNGYYVLVIPESASGKIFLNGSTLNFGFSPVVKEKKKRNL